jgi:hypothetical protein
MNKLSVRFECIADLRVLVRIAVVLDDWDVMRVERFAARPFLAGIAYARPTLAISGAYIALGCA